MDNTQKDNNSTFSASNPASGLDALCGKSYTFKGKEVKATNAALLAVARAGIPIEKMSQRLFEAVPIAAWAMYSELNDVVPLLSNPEKLKETAYRFFCEEMNEEDFGAAMSIVTDGLLRFEKSFTQYENRNHKGGSDSGNVKMNADIS